MKHKIKEKKKWQLLTNWLIRKHQQFLRKCREGESDSLWVREGEDWRRWRAAGWRRLWTSEEKNENEGRERLQRRRYGKHVRLLGFFFLLIRIDEGQRGDGQVPKVF